jgi:hypothetical protein
LKSKAWVRLIDRSAKTAAVVIFLGNVSMPLAILAGLVK